MKNIHFHIGQPKTIVLLGVSKHFRWFLLPKNSPLRHYVKKLNHPITTTSVFTSRTSLFLNTCFTVLFVCINVLMQFSSRLFCSRSVTCWYRKRRAINCEFWCFLITFFFHDSARYKHKKLIIVTGNFNLFAQVVKCIHRFVSLALNLKTPQILADSFTQNYGYFKEYQPQCSVVWKFEPFERLRLCQALSF